MDLKKIVVDALPEPLKKYEKMVTTCSDGKKGDFTIPCFAMAKELKQSPVLIANNLASENWNSDVILKVEAVNGYLNLFLNKQYIAQVILEEYQNEGLEGFKTNEGNGKTICIDYSSANLAKYLHIGHLSTTILGECLARLFDNAGYRVIRINFVGDYGTPFGKIISAYKLWGNKEDVEKRGVDAIQDLYVKFCKHEGEPKYDEMARECFTKIENKDPETMKLYNAILDISLKYNKEATKALGVKFDDYNGEAYYHDKMDGVVEQLEKKGLLVEGEGGSKIINLDKLGVALIKKSDGSSLYLTRDIAAAIDRYNKYNFYKNYYVTDVAQKLHFDQTFKILELMGYDFAKDCKHIYYGRIRLPEGKISSRLGKQALIKEIVDESINKVKEIIKDRNLPNAEEVAEVVGKGAVIYTVTKNEKIKDTVFDMNEALRFEGETSPYMQYTYARCSSILRKANTWNQVDYKYLASDDSYSLIKLLAGFKNAIKCATDNLEPNMISKYTMDICKAVNKFYTTERVISENKIETASKCKLISMARDCIKFGLHLICIETVESM